MAVHSTGRRSYSEVDAIPGDFLKYMLSGVHTGRGTGHQIATTNTIVRGLAQDPNVQTLIAADKICYFAGAKGGKNQRNVDLIFGPPTPGARFDDTVGMLLGMPVAPVISGEYKTIMTELGKNAGNRLSDFETHASAAARHGAQFTFAVCAVNAADEYFSYTANAFRNQRDGKTNAARAVDKLRECLTSGIDLLWTPVLDANNHPDESLRFARWLKGFPQPSDGDELGWGHFRWTLAQACVKILG